KILKQLALRAFGARFTFRPKSGFGLPLSTFYQQPRFEQLMEGEILPGMRQRQIIQCELVEKWWGKRYQLRPSMGELLWTTIAFELWAKNFLGKGRSTQ